MGLETFPGADIHYPQTGFGGERDRLLEQHVVARVERRQGGLHVLGVASGDDRHRGAARRRERPHCRPGIIDNATTNSHHIRRFKGSKVTRQQKRSNWLGQQQWLL